jgi:rare lipoprotein A
MRMRTAIGLSLTLLLGSTAAMAERPPAEHRPAPSIKSKPAKSQAASRKSGNPRHRTASQAAARSERRHKPSETRGQTAEHAERATRLPPPDEYIRSVKPIGRREIGVAAWYGGRHIGKRTASGELLDAVRPTAAHRDLPLHSLVRVTNLSNGRSAIVTITDRGPVSRSLLIDVSPAVADELDMRRSGIAHVSVEPVAQTASSVH